jgi:hypothetical protein
MHTVFWLGNLSEIQSLEDPGVDGRIGLKLFLKGRGCETD